MEKTNCRTIEARRKNGRKSGKLFSRTRFTSTTTGTEKKNQAGVVKGGEGQWER